MKIKKGDIVKIITGNDKGKQGKVLKVFPMEERITIEGLNLKKKHVRPKKQGQKGELVKIAMPLPSSRAMLVCGACGKTVRAGFSGKGETKVRVCKNCKKEI